MTELRDIPADRIVDFDIYDPPEVEKGFHEAWLKLREESGARLMWSTRNGGHWIVTDGQMVSDVYGDYEHFSNRVMLVPKLNGDGRCPRHIVPSYVDPPEHRAYRNILNSSFAPRAVAQLDGVIRSLSRELIDQVHASGRCDFIRAYAEILPIQIFMTLVDLPLADVPKLKAWVHCNDHVDSDLSIEETKRLITEAHDNIHAYLRPHIEARIGGDGQDMLSRFVNASVDGRPLDAQEMMDMCTQVMFGGLDTVMNFLGFVMLFLARNPEQRQRLIADKGLVPAAVDELLRRYPLVTVGREVKRDVELDGMILRKGDMIMAPTPLAGLDERRNACPMQVDFDRDAAWHATFGNGPHKCPGAALARLEVRVTIEEWLARIPDFEVEPGHEIVYRGGVVGSVRELPLRWGA